MNLGEFIRTHTRKRIGQISFHVSLLLTLVFLFSFKIHSAEFHSSHADTHTSTYVSHMAASAIQHTTDHKEVRISIDKIIESEEDDIQQDDTDCDCESSSVCKYYNPIAENKLSFLPQQFFSKHCDIPLFVLYHSWKNFIY